MTSSRPSLSSSRRLFNIMKKDIANTSEKTFNIYDFKFIWNNIIVNYLNCLRTDALTYAQCKNPNGYKNAVINSKEFSDIKKELEKKYAKFETYVINEKVENDLTTILDKKMNEDIYGGKNMLNTKKKIIEKKKKTNGSEEEFEEYEVLETCAGLYETNEYNSKLTKSLFIIMNTLKKVIENYITVFENIITFLDGNMINYIKNEVVNKVSDDELSKYVKIYNTNTYVKNYNNNTHSYEITSVLDFKKNLFDMLSISDNLRLVSLSKPLDIIPLSNIPDDSEVLAENKNLSSLCNIYIKCFYGTTHTSNYMNFKKIDSSLTKNEKLLFIINFELVMVRKFLNVVISEYKEILTDIRVLFCTNNDHLNLPIPILPLLYDSNPDGELCSLCSSYCLQSSNADDICNICANTFKKFRSNYALLFNTMVKRMTNTTEYYQFLLSKDINKYQNDFLNSSRDGKSIFSTFFNNSIIDVSYDDCSVDKFQNFITNKQLFYKSIFKIHFKMLHYSE